MSTTADDEDLEKLIERYICTKNGQLNITLLRQLVCASKSDRVLEILMKQRGSRRYTSLHCAAMRNDPDTVGHLLNCVAPESRLRLIDVRDTIGQTALHRAAVAGMKAPMERMLDSLSSPELQIDVIELIDNLGKCARTQAIQFNRVGAAIFLQTRIRGLKERIEKKKSLPEEQGRYAIDDAIWVLELVCKQQEVEYLKLKAEQDDSLLNNNINMSLEQIKVRRARINELKEKVKSTCSSIAENNTNVSKMSSDDEAEAARKAKLTDRIQKIESRHKLRSKELDILSSQLDMLEVMSRQSAEIAKLMDSQTGFAQMLKEKDDRIKEQEAKLTEFQASQTRKNEGVEADVNNLIENQKDHNVRLDDAENKIVTLEDKELPKFGAAIHQPLENEGRVVVTNTEEDNAQ